MQIAGAVVERPRLPGARAVVGRRRLRRAYAFVFGEMIFLDYCRHEAILNLPLKKCKPLLKSA